MARWPQFLRRFPFLPLALYHILLHFFTFQWPSRLAIKCNLKKKKKTTTGLFQISHLPEDLQQALENKATDRRRLVSKKGRAPGRFKCLTVRAMYRLWNCSKKNGRIHKNTQTSNNTEKALQNHQQTNVKTILFSKISLIIRKPTWHRNQAACPPPPHIHR